MHLPSANTIKVHSKLYFEYENGEEYDASDFVKEIPISAYLIAGQSFAPSPIIPILSLSTTYMRWMIYAFCSGLNLAKIEVSLRRLLRDGIDEI